MPVVRERNQNEIIVVEGQSGSGSLAITTVPRGPQGPRGLSPITSTYKQETVTINNGILTVDAPTASTFYVVIDQNITSILLTNWPASGNSQRIAIYFQQDGIGGRTITGWPANTLSPNGQKPSLTQLPNAIDCVVIDSFDGGNTFFVTLVGNNYS